MRTALYRACEIAAVAAILALAGFQIWQGLGDPAREFIAVAGACVGLMGVAAAEFVGGRPKEPTAPPQQPEAVLKGAMDRVLMGLRGYLEDNLKGRAKTARYGGEEFALLLPGGPFPKARRIVEALRRDLEAKRWVVGPREQPLGVVTPTLGLAKLAPGETAESFVHRADARLMHAKTTGRDRVVVDDSVASANRAAARG